MNKYKVLGLSFLLAIGFTGNAQQNKKSKQKYSADSQIVMSKDELKSFLKMVAEKRIEQIKRFEKQDSISYYVGSFSEVPVQKSQKAKKSCGSCQKNDLASQVQKVNDRLDNLMLALIGKGGASNVVVPGQGSTTSYLDNGTSSQISALEQKLDSLKRLQSSFNNSTSTISPERRSALEELLAKYKNFKRQVYFANNSYAVSSDDIAYINDVAKVLKQNPELSVVLEGYASNVGSVEYNNQLSMKRAEAITKALVDRGISRDRLYSAFFGIDKGVPAAKARRVDMTVVIK
ncbi:OmpA family protein [Ornithobacterium rhinotracheale]|uniref:OmpA family protein n=1 Tax=Ornithobacterium rhinotracheale TaxID=28251 RepID=UPI001FF6016D|nr:OmpA family protein [Ornithobacterium rhinotracheale]MCK0201559.1 OmpA family protein [Ornithobacterium rhinotracheale]